MSDDDLQDELLSRALDGDLDTDEQARVRTDADLATRLAALAQVRARLADVPPLAPEVADSLIARAVAEATAGSPPTATVTPLARRRHGWLAAAAAVVVLAGAGIAVVAQRGGGGDSSTADPAATIPDATTPDVLAATADSAATPGGTDGQDAATESAGAADAATEPAPSALAAARVELADTAALAELAAGPTTLAPADDPCPEDAGTSIALARFEGQDVVVVRTADEREARALDVTTCQVVAVVAIP